MDLNVDGLIPQVDAALAKSANIGRVEQDHLFGFGHSVVNAIEGPLASPSVKVSSVGATARMVEEVLLTPINLLGSLLR